MAGAGYRAQRDVAWERLRDELALLHLERGVYYGLNATGALLWEALQEVCTIDDLVARLAASCKVTPEACRADVERLVDELLAAGLVARVDRG